MRARKENDDRKKIVEGKKEVSVKQVRKCIESGSEVRVQYRLEKMRMVIIVKRGRM